jgi:hypothetical protein
MTRKDSDTSLYTKVVAVTADYLGPAADRFISRQIRNHLHKTPETIARTDLADLIDWIKLAMALLTDDEKLIKEYITSLKELTKAPEHRKKVRT